MGMGWLKNGDFWVTSTNPWGPLDCCWVINLLTMVRIMPWEALLRCCLALETSILGLLAPWWAKLGWPITPLCLNPDPGRVPLFLLSGPPNQ